MNVDDILDDYVEERNPSVAHVLQFFSCEHLSGEIRSISKVCQELAIEMCDEISDNPELTVGLRKLLEAKDCFVRAALLDE